MDCRGEQSATALWNASARMKAPSSLRFASAVQNALGELGSHFEIVASRFMGRVLLPLKREELNGVTERTRYGRSTRLSLALRDCGDTTLPVPLLQFMNRSKDCE
jgi:hypothetical protein